MMDLHSSVELLPSHVPHTYIFMYNPYIITYNPYNPYIITYNPYNPYIIMYNRSLHNPYNPYIIMYNHVQICNKWCARAAWATVNARHAVFITILLDVAGVPTPATPHDQLCFKICFLTWLPNKQDIVQFVTHTYII